MENGKCVQSDVSCVCLKVEIGMARTHAGRQQGEEGKEGAGKAEACWAGTQGNIRDTVTDIGGESIEAARNVREGRNTKQGGKQWIETKRGEIYEKGREKVRLSRRGARCGKGRQE